MSERPAGSCGFQELPARRARHTPAFLIVYTELILETLLLKCNTCARPGDERIEGGRHKFLLISESFL